MKAAKRYLLVVFCAAFLCASYFGSFAPSLYSGSVSTVYDAQFASLHATADWMFRAVSDPVSNRSQQQPSLQVHPAHCRMHTCFDLARCRGRAFRVFVYPAGWSLSSSAQEDGVSEAYGRMLRSLLDSRLLTDRPDEACVFVVAIDTLDRDPLSTDYVHRLSTKIKQLPLWNEGRNHVVFNLFSGTWPDYSEHVDWDVGYAILAKASLSERNFRDGFDISLPLLSKDHVERGGRETRVTSLNYPARKQYLLSFKGKRYVYGIGSRARNTLFHLHNGDDVVMATTCRHGKNWRRLQDSRCAADMSNYDKYDYEDLLRNSTFCLVPRGRRVGSFRFLEVMQAGCVPVILANGWRLPFDEVIAWRDVVVWANERTLMQLPDTLRQMSPVEVLRRRHMTRLLWSSYFSSVQQVVMTTMRIIEARVHSDRAAFKADWMSWPGRLMHVETEADETGVPRVLAPPSPAAVTAESTADSQPANFTAVVVCRRASYTKLFRLIREVCGSQFISSVVLLWMPVESSQYSDESVTLSHVAARLRPSVHVPLHVQTFQRSSPSNRFLPNSLITTHAVLSLEDDDFLVADEIDFMYEVWRRFPDRLVGLSSRSHYWDVKTSRWLYTSKLLNEFSMVLPSGAMYHKFYHYFYTNWSSEAMLRTVDTTSACEDILMNFLVAHLTRRPPIKILSRRHLKMNRKNSWLNSSLSLEANGDEWWRMQQRHTCLNTLVALFGRMPLLTSTVKLEPLLHGDRVAGWRKKYRQLETMSVYSPQLSH